MAAFHLPSSNKCSLARSAITEAFSSVTCYSSFVPKLYTSRKAFPLSAAAESLAPGLHLPWDQNLAKLISTSVDSLDKTCTENKIRIPSLDEPFSADAEVALMTPEALESVNSIVTNALKLAAAVSPAQITMFRMAGDYMKTATLGTAIRCHVSEILRDAGSKAGFGRHCSKPLHSDVDGRKLGPVLRYLASNNVFREVSPNVFANNRFSGTLDTGKDIGDILQSNLTKHDETNGLASWIETICTECLKAGSVQADTILDPRTAHSTDQADSALARAFGFNVPYEEWIARAEQQYLQKRWSSMASGAMADHVWTRSVVDCLELDKLPKNAVIVDISTTHSHPSALEIAKLYPDMQFVVQQPPLAIEETKKMWKTTQIEATSAGPVRFQEHNLLDLQPIRDASLFILGTTLSLWSDVYAKKILTNLRQASTKEVNLVLTAVLIPEHFDQGAELHYMLSMAIRKPSFTITLDAWNCPERTLSEWTALLKSSGWEISKVTKGKNLQSTICAVPA
ncbi:hypothetical protein C8J56DRAFT_1076296 [Mycena floridula]|nr:hypothetical protein C8J56DRAFT_1076296 [Mycena floridula]